MTKRPAVFKWRQSEPEIILCAVRWYLRYSLSLRNVEELLIERGLGADHTTVWRWVQRYAPEFEQRMRRHLKSTNKSWRVDETYVRVKGRWCYLYRAIDSAGATIDFLLSALRDADAAKRLFRNALKDPSHLQPRHQYGSGSNLQLRHLRHQEGWDTSTSLSASARAVPEQYLGAGPPSHQAACKCQTGIPRIPSGTADHPRL
jgi:hypothetical protein